MIEDEKVWPDFGCPIDFPHVHVVGHDAQRGSRNINILAPFGQYTTASNGWGDSIEISFHPGEHASEIPAGTN